MIDGMVWHCELHAHRLRGAGRPQLRRWNAPLARGANARRAPSGRRRDRPALVVARSLAGRFRRHRARRIPQAPGIRLCRVLPRALPHLVVLDLARRLAGSGRPHQRPHVAGVLGFRLRARQYASGRPFRRRGGQPGPRCSACFRRHVLHGLLHRFHATRRRGAARLVHGIGRDLRGRRARGARCDLSHAQDGRRRARPQRTLRAGTLGRGRAAAGGHHRRNRRSAPRRDRARDSQPVLLARTAPRLHRGVRAGFRVGNAARNACVHRFEPAACRPAGHPGGGDFPGRLAFDAGARKLTHRLRRRRRSQFAGLRRDLVADRFRPGGRVFRFRLATIRRQSQRQRDNQGFY